MSSPPTELPPDAGPDDSLSSRQLAIVGTLCGFQLLVLLLRLPLRIFFLKSVGKDDYLISAASLMGVGVLICFVGETQNGMGRHAFYLSLAEQSKIAEWQFYHSIIVMLGISFVKLSIGFVLLRFVYSVPYKRFIWGMIFFLIAFTIACAGTLIFSCVPVSASWNFAEQATATCFSIQTFTAIGLFNSSVNATTDLIFVALPIPVISSLQANRRTKVTLILILGLGIFAAAASLVKIRYQVTALSEPDGTRYNLFNIWNAVELYIGIIAACLPTLRPLFRQILGSTARSWSSWRPSDGGQGSAPKSPGFGPGPGGNRASVGNRASGGRRVSRRMRGEENDSMEELAQFEGRLGMGSGMGWHKDEEAETRTRIEAFSRSERAGSGWKRSRERLPGSSGSEDGEVEAGFGKRLEDVPEGSIVKTVDIAVR